MVTSESQPLLRVFVMGCSRSGTTLTQRLGLATLLEPLFFASLARNLEPRMFSRAQRRLLGLKPVTSRLREALGRGTGQEWRNVQGLPRPPAWRWWRFGPASAEFVARLDALTLEAGWLEKAPFQFLYAPVIACLVPDAGMIHMVRYARETVASIREVALRHPASWDLTYHQPKPSADAWNASVAASTRMVGWPLQLFVPYAALATRPEVVLGLVVRRMAPVLAGLVESVKSWKAGALAGPVAPADSKWMATLDADERARVEAMIEPLPVALEKAMRPFLDLAGSPGSLQAARPEVLEDAR